MVQWKNWRWAAAATVGLIAGLALSGFWPSIPLHAVATDRGENYAMATGPVSADVEAVYLLDLMTGDLGAFVLGRKPDMWSGVFRANVAADLRVDPQKNPKFLMVTGLAALQPGGGSHQQWSGSLCYVAELTTGRMAAYAIPWSRPQFAAGQPQIMPLILVGVLPFRQGGDIGAFETPAAQALKKREKK